MVSREKEKKKRRTEGKKERKNTHLQPTELLLPPGTKKKPKKTKSEQKTNKIKTNIMMFIIAFKDIGMNRVSKALETLLTASLQKQPTHTPSSFSQRKPENKTK